jgi:serine protease Do
MSQLIATGHVERAVMGVSIRPIRPEDAENAKLSDIRGVVVDAFSGEDSPAKRAGIQEGDVIVSLDGQSVESVPQLQQRVGFKKPGETVQVTVVRTGGVRKTVTVKLTAAPNTDAEQTSDNDNGGASSNGSAPMENKLGVSVQPVSASDVNDRGLQEALRSGGGLMVEEVSPDGPAYQRLFDPSSGSPDIILKVNETPVRTRAELRKTLANVKRGDIVTLTVLSNTSDGWLSRVVRIRAG